MVFTPTGQKPKDASPQPGGNSSTSAQGSTKVIQVSDFQQGKLKFYNEDKDYGFLVPDAGGPDLFVHSEDLSKAQISRDILAKSKYKYVIRFEFLVMTY